MVPDDSSEMTLELTPAQFRELGYKAIDLIADNLDRLQNRLEPARRAVPPELREQLLTQVLPQGGKDPRELIEFVGRDILPYPRGNIHPRFFAWVNSPAAPISIIGELLAAGMNSSTAGGDQASSYLEHAVLDWLKEIMGFPKDSGALLVSGGSMATLLGLAVMRHAKAQTGHMRGKGMQQESAPMIVYASTEGHSCITKAVELLGIGHNYLRKIPVDSDFRMDVARLEQQIKTDRRTGLHPVCVAASAGTVNTGAIDPLDRIADLCQQENLWFHIDAAYGGVGMLAEKTKRWFTGIERADSLGVDPHKWMYIPVECGCAIVRDKQAMRDTFSEVPPYLRDDRQSPWFSEFGPQQTRGFRALKLWLAIKHIGLEGYRRLITRDINLAESLRKKIKSRADFELVAAGPLSVTCFRYVTPDSADLGALNRSILEIVQNTGDVYLTSTELNGEFVLRANIMNFRTTEPDLDFLLDTIARVGQRVLALRT
jgi:glutamate/tyrosine decarboxylase-like PLP-dependent enzyme